MPTESDKLAQSVIEKRHQTMTASLIRNSSKADIAGMLANHIMIAEDRERAVSIEQRGDKLVENYGKPQTEPLTMQTHFGDCKQLQAVLDNANDLASRATILLKRIREGLGVMKEASHPLVKVRVPQHLKEMDFRTDEHESCAWLIDRQVKQIDEILGDRAS